MSFLLGSLGVLFSISWLVAFASITFLSPWSPKCRAAKSKWTSDDGFKVVRHAVVTRAKGKVVCEHVDPEGPSDIQHVVIVWGVLKLVPTRFLRLVTFQLKQWTRFGKKVSYYKSWSVFPVTNAHLVGFDLVSEGDDIDLQGAQIIEMSDEDGHKIMTGARDLRTWSHKKCPWLIKPDHDEQASDTPDVVVITA